MNRNELLDQFRDVLQIDYNLSEDTNLSDIEEWDSMAVLGLMSLYDELFDLKLTVDQVRSAVTVKEILDLVNSKLIS